MVQAPPDVEGVVDERVDHPVGQRDREFLGRLGGLVLVEEGHLRERQTHELGEPEVDVALADVGAEGPRDALPEPVEIEHGLTGRGLVGVLTDQLRGVQAERADTDALDLDHGVQVRDGPVGMTDYQVTVLRVERDLRVGERLGVGPAHEALLRTEAAYIAILVATRQTFPEPPETTHFRQPTLPFRVDGVALLENGVELGADLLGRDLPAGADGPDPVVGRPRAPVRLRHFRRVDDVLAALVLALLDDPVGLDVGEETAGLLDVGQVS